MQKLLFLLVVLLIGCNGKNQEELLKASLKDIVSEYVNRNSELSRKIIIMIKQEGNRPDDMVIHDSVLSIHTSAEALFNQNRDAGYINELSKYSNRLVRITKEMGIYPEEIVLRLTEGGKNKDIDSLNLLGFQLDILQLENFILNDLAAKVGSVNCFGVGSVTYCSADTFDTNENVEFAIVPDFYKNTEIDGHFDSLNVFIEGKKVKVPYKIKGIGNVGLIQLEISEKGVYLVEGFITVSWKEAAEPRSLTYRKKLVVQ